MSKYFLTFTFIKQKKQDSNLNCAMRNSFSNMTYIKDIIRKKKCREQN